MSRLVKIRKTATCTFALFDVSSAYVIEAWRYDDDSKELVDEIPYHGGADRVAARYLALGTLATVPEDWRTAMPASERVPASGQSTEED